LNRRIAPSSSKSVAKIDPSIEVIAANAEFDSARQLAQGEAALTRGADALVVIPIEDSSTAPIVEMAHRQQVPVLAYDGIDQGRTPGRLRLVRQSESRRASGALRGRAHSPWRQHRADKRRSDLRSVQGLQGRRPVAAAGKIKLAYEADAKDWLASNGQREVEQALTATNDKIDAIIATNDTLAQASSRR
jgi:D-xylose transport system substrate-binding protein